MCAVVRRCSAIFCSIKFSSLHSFHTVFRRGETVNEKMYSPICFEGVRGLKYLWLWGPLHAWFSCLAQLENKSFHMTLLISNALGAKFFFLKSWRFSENWRRCNWPNMRTKRSTRGLWLKGLRESDGLIEKSFTTYISANQVSAKM